MLTSLYLVYILFLQMKRLLGGGGGGVPFVVYIDYQSTDLLTGP